MVAEALDRARAYADAGADGLFAPGLTNLALIERLVKASPLPVNIMAVDTTPSISELKRHGVSRVSYGPGPYLTAMKALEEAARAALQ
jgi:2-methylisocitrate lyase-like PEP mutase family enzyme